MKSIDIFLYQFNSAHLIKYLDMWEDGSSEEGSEEAGKNFDVKQYDNVFNELMQECKHSAPGARLSARLRTSLER